MSEFFWVLGAGLLGVIGNWATRYSQGRTDSTFMEYLMHRKATTVSSLFSILASSSLIYQSMPPTAHGRELLVFLLGAYSTGYMLDRTVNRDKPIETLPANTQEIADADKHKALDDILGDDDALGR